MKLQIIETPDYILVVSDKIEDGINPKVLYFDNKIDKNNIYKSSEMFTENPIYLYVSGIDDNFRTVRKIIAYQPKNNAPELDLPLLPEMVVEDDVEKLAHNYLNENYEYVWDDGDVKTFIEGYKAATKVYNEEDLRKAYTKGFSEGIIKGTCNMVYKHETFDEYLKLIKESKTLKWFVAEMEEECGYNSNGYYSSIVLKTTAINDKIYLTGTYLYE
jgi:hypothetical protein